MNQMSDFHVPDEIPRMIPTDAYEQLDLARKITSLAIASRVSKLESENERLKRKVPEKDRSIEGLQREHSWFEKSFREAEDRLRIVIDDSAKLARERDSKTWASKKLARDLSKLETFRKHLMHSFSDDSPSAFLENTNGVIQTRDL